MKLLSGWKRGKLLAELRGNKGLTQKALSKEIGLSRGQIQRHESGENISIEALGKYMQFYGVSCDYILCGISNSYCDDVQALADKLDDFLKFQKNLPEELEVICHRLKFEQTNLKNKQ